MTPTPADPKLRIAVVHSYYSSRQPSGENAVVDAELCALRGIGHVVRLFSQRTDERQTRGLYGLQAATTTATGYGPDPLSELRAFRPDIVHVHNLFPNFGRRWVLDWDGPLIATLHNFRPVCAAATLYRDGQVCTDCLSRGSSWPAVRHACYRGSHVKSIPVALGTRFAADPVLRRADRILVLSEAMRDLYVNAGVDRERITLVPNFLSTPPAVGRGGGAWVFVGRLAPEKGVLDLLLEWPADLPLRIIGEGPLIEEVRAASVGAAVTVLGRKSAEEVRLELTAARGLVFPSRWLEGLPLVYLEALAAGTPVLAWKPSSVAQLVESQGTGLVVAELKSSLEKAEAQFPTLREHCRAVFDSSYTAGSWLDAISDVYSEVISSA